MGIEKERQVGFIWTAGTCFWKVMNRAAQCSIYINNSFIRRVHKTKRLVTSLRLSDRPSVRRSVCMELGSHWTDFHEI